MKTSFLILALWWTAPAFGFSMVGPSGMDLQSAALMKLCMEKAEQAVLRVEERYQETQCGNERARIVPHTTKLTGLAMDKKGFVYEVDLTSGCSRTLRYEVEVGPANDGRRCDLLSEPQVVGSY